MSEKILNFLTGFGSILSVMPPPADTPVSAPHLTISVDNDWQFVGDDLAGAMRDIDAETQHHEPVGRK